MVQSANFFGLLERDAVFVDLFNRVFHNFCEELFLRAVSCPNCVCRFPFTVCRARSNSCHSVFRYENG